MVEVVVTERRANKPGPSRFVLRVAGRAPAPLRRCTDCGRPLTELEAITCARCEVRERSELRALLAPPANAEAPCEG